MISFVRKDAAEGARELGGRLVALLGAGKRVLWLVSGGSNVPIVIAVMQQLPDELTSQLTIALADERYGPVGHADSNARKLLDGGFSPKRATFVPVLGDSHSLDEAGSAYATRIEALFASSDVVVAQLGIGADGHTAGILPESPAVHEETKWAIGYQGPDFSRITLTFPAIRRITIAYVFAYGTNKHSVLRQLRNTALPLAIQPAQILKSIPEATVYTDYVD